MQNNNLQVKNGNTSIMASKEMAIVMPLVEDYQKVFGDIKDIEKAKKNLFIFATKLATTKSKTGLPAVEVCTKESIMEVAFRCMNENIDLSKSHGALIVYGNKLTLQNEYFGNVAKAKEVYGNNIEFRSQLVYPKDQFEINKNGYAFGIDTYTHKSNPMNMVKQDQSGRIIDRVTPLFVYTYVVDKNDNTKLIASNVKSYLDCYQSWLQSGKIGDVHKKFPGDMMIKTNESWLAKHLYNKTIDNGEYIEEEETEEYEDSGKVIEIENPQNLLNTEFSKENRIISKEKEKNAVTREKTAKNEEIETNNSNDFVGNEEKVGFEYIDYSDNSAKIVQDTPITEENVYEMAYQDTYNSVENNNNAPMADFMPEQIGEDACEKEVQYSKWKNELKDSGEWEMVKGSWNAITKTVRVRKVN